MKSLILSMLIIQGLLSAPLFGQLPEGFRWLNLKDEVSTLSKVSAALKKEDYSSIREVGVTQNHALVFTSSREAGAPTPDYDLWRAYDISLKDGSSREILHGYKLEFKDWLQLSNAPRELAITYLTCWECEPTSIFTTLHFDPQTGWQARWKNAEEPGQPGIFFAATDVGDPFTDEIDVSQVFAPVMSPRGSVSFGTWYYSRDTRTRKINNVVERYSVDPTGKDIHETLQGREATIYAAELCRAKPSSPDINIGQQSPACKKLRNSTKP